MHTWIPVDDIVVYYLHKFEGRGITFSVDRIGEMLEMGGNSLRMRIRNFEALDGAGHLDHWAMISEAVYHQYSDVAEQDHRAEVLKILRS